MQGMRAGRMKPGRLWLVGPSLVFLLFTFGVPLICVAVYSLHRFSYGRPLPGLTLDNYVRLFTGTVYIGSLVQSILFVGAVSVITVAISIPPAYYIAFHVDHRKKAFYLGACALPFLASFLARVIACLSLFGGEGAINNALVELGVTSAPFGFFNIGRPAVFMTFINLLCPLSFFAVYAALEKVDSDLIWAARDLGANGIRILRRVILPLSASGLASAFTLVFLAMFGDYITPMLLGGTEGVLFVNLVVNQFGASLQWGFGAAMALVMVVVTAILLAVLRDLVSSVHASDAPRRQPHLAPVWMRAYLWLFFIFLYSPVLILLLFSLNASSTVGFPITGLSVKWFARELANPALVSALGKSLVIGASSAVVATALGLTAALGLSRSPARTQNAIAGFMTMPLFMPPAILGIGIVLSLHAAGIPRSMLTLIISHSLLTMPVAFLILMARVSGLTANQELAAQDLGASPFRAVTRITIPQVYAALLASLVLTFTFSLDEFIMTFLVTGNDVTLPLFLYSFIRYQMNPGVMASAAIILLLSILVMLAGLLAYRLANRVSRYRSA
jgi:ABC-type spermidine/putrescine transport system permease subunit II